MITSSKCRLLYLAVRNPISIPALHPVAFLQNLTKSITVTSHTSSDSFSRRHLSVSTSMAFCDSGCGNTFSKEALKQKLTAQQYQVTQEKDTERQFSGKYCHHFEKGIYACVVCSQKIFSSESKYDSKCGWPAFFDTISSSCVKLRNDYSHVSCNLLLLTTKTDMKRTEVACSKCGAHLGHVFDDGPKPTGKRYCINSVSLDFKEAEDNSLPSSSS